MFKIQGLEELVEVFHYVKSLITIKGKRDSLLECGDPRSVVGRGKEKI